MAEGYLRGAVVVVVGARQDGGYHANSAEQVEDSHDEAESAEEDGSARESGWEGGRRETHRYLCRNSRTKTAVI